MNNLMRINNIEQLKPKQEPEIVVGRPHGLSSAAINRPKSVDRDSAAPISGDGPARNKKLMDNRGN